jgi:preprotein translocase subunit SecA
VGQHLGTALEADKLDLGDLEMLKEQVRDLAGHELRSTVQRTFGEYVDATLPAEEWDLRGLSRWAAGFGLSLTQNQIRNSDPDELLEQISEAAVSKIEAEALAPLEQYIDPLYARARLVRWARDKFDVEIPLDDLATAQREDAERIIRERMREAYRKREIEYPCGAVIDFALQRGGTNINEVYGRIAAWVSRKYGLKWTYEHFAGKDPQQIFEELVSLNEDHLANGRLDGEIDAAIETHPGDAIVKWARERFGTVVEANPVEPGPNVRDQLRRCGYEMLRFELTQLERYVLLSTFDAVWKDHMYSMDLLRHGIGLRGYAERDPKIEYKREGTRLFNEMLGNIRERVTDLIFKVRVTPPGGADALGGDVPAAPAPGAGGGAAYAGMTAAKADATNAAFADAASDHEAAMRKQGEGGKPQPIRREVPKVGRNAPCPCGSGKKYKQCCGKPK